MKTLIAYHNDPDLKAKLLTELEKHRAADAIVQGTYGEDHEDNAVEFRGCAVGCTLHSLGHTEYDDHEAYVTLLGVPEPLAYLQDAIFEGLAISEAKE